MKEEHTPRVLFLVSHGFDACLLWRCWFVVKALRAAGYVAEWRYFERFNAECKPLLYSGRFNVIITPRYCLRETWMTERWAYLIKDAGLAWCYEADDDLFSREVLKRQADFFFTLWPDAEHAGVEWQLEWELNERIRILSMVDGAIVSSEPLAHVVRQHTDATVTVVPNGIDLDWFKNRMQRKQRWISPLTIGWSGGWRIPQDIEPVAEAWERLAVRYPDIKFVVYGWEAPLFKSLISQGRLTVIPWGPIGKYPAGLRNIDIACCSVSDNEWNLRKTPIKWMEATVAGAACVVSRALYDPFVTAELNALVATTTDEWEYQLSRLVESASLRRMINMQARATVGWRHQIERTLPLWVDAWSDMLVRKDGRLPNSA